MKRFVLSFCILLTSCTLVDPLQKQFNFFPDPNNEKERGKELTLPPAFDTLPAPKNKVEQLSKKIEEKILQQTKVANSNEKLVEVTGANSPKVSAPQTVAIIPKSEEKACPYKDKVLSLNEMINESATESHKTKKVSKKNSPSSDRKKKREDNRTPLMLVVQPSVDSADKGIYKVKSVEETKKKDKKKNYSLNKNKDVKRMENLDRKMSESQMRSAELQKAKRMNKGHALRSDSPPQVIQDNTQIQNHSQLRHSHSPSLNRPVHVVQDKEERAKLKELERVEDIFKGADPKEDEAFWNS